MMLNVTALSLASQLLQGGARGEIRYGGGAIR